MKVLASDGVVNDHRPSRRDQLCHDAFRTICGDLLQVRTSAHCERNLVDIRRAIEILDVEKE